MEKKKISTKHVQSILNVISELPSAELDYSYVRYTIC